MAKTKISAPDGYHFMIKKSGNFYLMKGDYTPHTLDNGDRASKFIELEYLTEHPLKNSTSTTSTRKSVKSATARSTRIVKNPKRTSTSSGSSSSGRY